jgi:hypothetical protein
VLRGWLGVPRDRMGARARRSSRTLDRCSVGSTISLISVRMKWVVARPTFSSRFGGGDGANALADRLSVLELAVHGWRTRIRVGSVLPRENSPSGCRVVRPGSRGSAESKRPPFLVGPSFGRFSTQPASMGFLLGDPDAGFRGKILPRIGET